MKLKKWYLFLVVLTCFLIGTQVNSIFAAEITEETYSVVYVDGSILQSGNGTNANGAFKTLEEAYTYIENHSPSLGGLVIICGDVDILSALNLSIYDINGTVTITSEYENENYLNSASLGLAAQLELSDKTVIENLDIVLKASSTNTSVFLYSGLDLQVGSGVTITEPGIAGWLKLFCGKQSGTGQSVRVSLMSGTYHTIFMGCNANDVTTGNIDLEIGTDVSADLLLLGPNKGISGNISLTMNGGSIETLYNNPGTNTGTAGNIVVNLNSGAIGRMTHYSDKINSVGTFVVNLHGGFNYGEGEFGDWTGVTTGTRTLNLIGFNDETDALKKGFWNNYDKVVIQNSDITYNYKLGSAPYVEVTNLSKLTLFRNSSNSGINIKGNIAGYGSIVYGPIIVYVDATKEIAGDGSSPGTAVTKLSSAYKLLDKQKGGIIVISGNVRIPTDLNTEDYLISGKVTLTSAILDEDYRDIASLIMVGSGRVFALSDITVMDKMNINLDGDSGSQLIYSGLNLEMTDTVTTSGNGNLKLFCGRMRDTTDKKISVSVYGGTFYQMFMGSNTSYDTGDVSLELGGNVRVNSSVVLGANSSKTGDLCFTMNGGFVKVIYDTPNSNGICGDVVLNLNAGAVTDIRDYNGKSGMQMGDITVHLNSSFGAGTASIGVWSSGAVNTGIKTLNLINYQADSMNSLGNYDVVNIFGNDIPEGYQAVTTIDSLNIYEYDGIVGLSLETFGHLATFGNGTNATFLGKVPTAFNGNKVRLEANEGTTLRIRPSQNQGVGRENYTIVENGSGRVVFEDPSYVGNEQILWVDFDEMTAIDESTWNNTGVISGTPEFVEGYNGTRAIHIMNSFGRENATHYITFPNLNGIDIRNEDYTVMFWYCPDNGGLTEWARSAQSSTAGTELDMNNVVIGGVVYSNKDTSNNTSGFTAAQLSQTKYFTMGFTDVEGNHSDADGINEMVDDSWHMVTITYDRDGYYSVFVDDEKVSAVDISSKYNQDLGMNTLVLGADVFGQYGLGNAVIDDFRVYKGAMTQTDIQANYYFERLKGLVNAVEDRVPILGTEYDTYKTAITDTNNTVKTYMQNLSLADYVLAIEKYEELRIAYETFLAAPQESANLAALLLSDIHIASAGDAGANKLDKIFADISSNNIPIDIVFNPGDYADDSKASTIRVAFSVQESVLNKYNLNNIPFVSAFGNHEIEWTATDANYKVSTPVYWEEMMKDLNTLVSAGTVTIDFAKHDTQSNSNSYGISYDGFHVLVLNSDYLAQTGNSKLYLDAEGNYSIAGNAVDPIRHGAHFYDSTLEWIEMVMDEYSEDQKPIFVLLHYPFENTVPFSLFNEITIMSNSIGRQDAVLRSLLANYDNVFYFSGHLHAPLGMTEIVEVTSAEGNSFMAVGLPGVKASSRAYSNVPTSWIMYVYDGEIVFRARDFSLGKWLPQYDVVVELNNQPKYL